MKSNSSLILFVPVNNNIASILLILVSNHCVKWLIGAHVPEEDGSFNPM